jgi:hypothetical protein
MPKLTKLEKLQASVEKAKQIAEEKAKAVKTKKAKLQTEISRLKRSETNAARAFETRKKILIGSLALKMMRGNPSLIYQFQAHLNFFTNEGDREMIADELGKVKNGNGNEVGNA